MVAHLSVESSLYNSRHRVWNKHYQARRYNPSRKVAINDAIQQGRRFFCARKHLISYADWISSERNKIHGRQIFSCRKTLGYGRYRRKRQVDFFSKANNITHQFQPCSNEEFGPRGQHSSWSGWYCRAPNMLQSCKDGEDISGIASISTGPTNFCQRWRVNWCNKFCSMGTCTIVVASTDERFCFV